MGTVNLDDAAIAAMLARSSGMREALQLAADGIATEAQRMAQAEAFLTGAYMRGIGGSVEGATDGQMVGRVTASDWKSVFVEFGGAKTPAKAILRRAGEAHGTFDGGTG